MKKTQNIPFFVKGIFLIIALFFSFGIYLSIPVLFNYKSIENVIEKKFYNDFKINLNINGDIKYQLLPKPHLLITNSSLSIDKGSGEEMLVDINKLKVFLDSKNLIFAYLKLYWNLNKMVLIQFLYQFLYHYYYQEILKKFYYFVVDSQSQYYYLKNL